MDTGRDTRRKFRRGARVLAQRRVGLMQIMPETWSHLRVRYGLGADPYDPGDNILAVAAYLRELYDRYGSPGFLAAYNAGPTRYEDHLTTSRSLPADTLAYIADVVPLIGVGTLEDLSLSWCARGPRVHCCGQSEARNHRSRHPIGGSGSRRPSRQIAHWTHLSPRSNGIFVPISERTSEP
jgi:Transglycosylase SLT domain